MKKTNKKKAVVSIYSDKLFGSRLRELRKERNLTQEKLAEQLMISYTHYNNIENGRKSCSLPLLLQICAVLKITPNTLLKDFISIDESCDITAWLSVLSSRELESFKILLSTYVEKILKKENKLL